MNKENKFQDQTRGELSFLFVGLYTWAATISFGAIVLDIVYSNLLWKISGSFETAPLFSEVADFLLLLGIFTIIAALVAIGFAWTSPLARNLFIASLAIVIFRFLIPPFFSQFFQDAEVAHGLGINQWVRLVLTGLPLILAFMGLHAFYRQT